MKPAVKLVTWRLSPTLCYVHV